VAFRQCLRVLKPGGRIMILEITPPRSAVSSYVFRAYFEKVLPRVIRLSTGSAEAELLLRYYWDTIAHCVPADAILESLRSSGFVDVKHRARGGVVLSSRDSLGKHERTRRIVDEQGAFSIARLESRRRVVPQNAHSWDRRLHFTDQR
jgi:hypothetical protein